MGRLLKVGLTGGLACGKSTVLRQLEQLGAQVLDADQLAREALAPGSPGLRAVVERFGAGLLREDGSLDRARLAALVFADPQARRDLEAIVHPEVGRRQLAWLAALAALAGDRVAVVDVPLLFEAGLERRFDLSLLVSCSPEQQLERALARGMSREDAEARIAAQWPDARKRELADLVLDNSGDQAQLRQRVRELWRSLQERLARRPEAGDD